MSANLLMSSSKNFPPVLPTAAMSGASFEQPRSRLTRRRVILFAGAGAVAISAELAATAIRRSGRPRPAAKPMLDIYEQVVPEQGIDTGVTFGDALQKLIAIGALDPEKVRAHGHTLPDWVEQLLAGPSEDPIVFTPARAPYLVNLLWPIGLSNRVAFNRQSPINTDNPSGFASTGGWTLGREPNGAAYFNKVDAFPLSERQAFLALAIATNTYRPCCDNITFFQDCNHGSALLGLIELAVSQGKAAGEVYRIALAANSYWFPERYARTAQYFSHLENRSWMRVSAPQVLGAAFSTLSGWKQHVNAPLRNAEVVPPVNPKAQPDAGCGL